MQCIVAGFAPIGRHKLSADALRLGPKLERSFSSATYPAILAKDRYTLSRSDADNFRRWTLFPAIFMIMAPTGAVYAWSMWSNLMTKTLGVLTPAALDWGLGGMGATYSCYAAAFGGGLVLLAPWMERVGVRYAAAVGSALFISGHLLSAIGVWTQALPLVWVGYGIATGLTACIQYVPPVIAALRWFPDRKGLATGLCMASVGGGGAVMTAMTESLTKMFFKVPTFAGAMGEVQVRLEEGRQFVNFEGEWCEAVYVKAADIASAPLSPDVASRLSEGFYLVGTGDTSCAIAFVVTGIAFTAASLVGAWAMRLPPEGWTPKGWTPPANAGVALTSGSVSASMALRTPQFYLMGSAVFFNSCAGIAVLAVAKAMIGEIFVDIYPGIVTAAFSTAFVGALGLCQVGARIAMASASDFLGRRNTVFLLGLSFPACLLVPSFTHLAASGAMGTLPLYFFYGACLSILATFGGLLGVLPSYTSELFGLKETSIIYARLCAGWSAAGVITPPSVAYMLGRSNSNAIESLVAVTNPAAFEQAFNAPVSELPLLVDSKTVTIARLMELVPPGTVDPTPFLYDSTFYGLSACLAVTQVSNMLIKKVDTKYLMAEESENSETDCNEQSVKTSGDSKK